MRFKLLIFIITVLTIGNCKKTYNPSVIQSGNNYLVVDGIINTTPNSRTTIHLTRSRNLGDSSTQGIPELNASVIVGSLNGNIIKLMDSANNGIYESIPNTLNVDDSYRFQITTEDGRQYISDYVSPLLTPGIDSIYWEQPGDLNIYLDTHDPTNVVKFYRWDYIETWAHDATLSTPWYVNNGLIEVVNDSTQTTNCWTSKMSSNILLASTVSLSDDIIKHQKLLTIPYGDSRIDKRYSMLVRQYALTDAAFNYWQLIQKTSQQLGGLFDPQPAQLIGNMHCLTNPNEPVIGFASASSVSEKRMFIYNTDLNNWGHGGLTYVCDTIDIPVNPIDYRIYSYPDTSYAPYYFITNGPLVLASKECLDCRLFGGTNVKPAFW